MILILSQNIDSTTDEVIEWINYYNCKVLRINGDNFYSDKNFSLADNFSFLPESKKISIIWYRRWAPTRIVDKILKPENIHFPHSLDYFLRKEISTLNQYLFHKYKSNKWLSHPNKGNINKLITLKRAKRCGLEIPNTYIATNKYYLKKILNRHGKIITKSIFNNPFFINTTSVSGVNTVLIERKNLHLINDIFFPSLIQEYIEKNFEIRSFYFEGNFYSMAIFSQNNAKTKIDFRNYNWNEPNRNVPYKLPSLVKDKLRLLMKSIGLETGSIDLIYNKGKYYFLEINPVGQFGMVSKPCKYNLEKKIAKYLVTHEKRNNL